MAHRDRKPYHPLQGAPSPRERALYDGLPSATNRQWGEDRSNDAYGYGYPGQGGWGDFSTRRAPSHADRDVARGGPADRGHRGRGPSGYVRSDERIADDIIGRLTDAPDIDAREILLSVEGGVATLTGNVPARAMKHRAEDIAADASGVREVRNTIRVDDGAASFGRRGEAVRSGL
ncbi:MAG: BON domain-containing protein [Luteimonas sp.]